MSDSDNPSRKTITLKTAQRRSDSPTRRSGARAHRVAQQALHRTEHAGQKAAAVKVRGADGAQHPDSEPAAGQAPRSTPEVYVRAPKAFRTAPQNRPRPGTSSALRAFATCPRGLETLLAQELEALGFQHVQAARSGCTFSTDSTGILKANLHSRLAARILLEVAQARVHREDDIYDLARQTPWEHWFGPRHSLRVDTSAVRSPMKSLQFCNLRVKDAICDRLREREGDRPSIDTVRPDARVHLFLSKDQATLYLDSSGESLFKRGWRLNKGEAPIRENLAAGMLALSGWEPGKVLLDPFCGSGTILIEAAWQALRIPAGILRPFQFERWRNFNSGIWQAMKTQALEERQPDAELQLFGSDADPDMLEAARLNLRRAKLPEQAIQLVQKNALDIAAPAASGVIVSNPPYNKRMSDEIDALWHPWSGVLKQRFAGWDIALISSDLSLPKRLRLQPKRKIPLFNGDLDCRLFLFEMVSESYRNPA